MNTTVFIRLILVAAAFLAAPYAFEIIILADMMFAEAIATFIVVFGQSASNYITQQSVALKVVIQATFEFDAAASDQQTGLYVFGCTASGLLILATGSAVIASLAWAPSIVYLT